MDNFGFRIAIREEGEFVNAYFAKPDTMDGSLFLGCIHKRMLKGHREIFDQWASLIAVAFSNVSIDLGGIEVAFTAVPVPEHERKLIDHDIS